jgi:hypothetical protein
MAAWVDERSCRVKEGGRREEREVRKWKELR